MSQQYPSTCSCISSKCFLKPIQISWIARHVCSHRMRKVVIHQLSDTTMHAFFVFLETKSLPRDLIYYHSTLSFRPTRLILHCDSSTHDLQDLCIHFPFGNIFYRTCKHRWSHQAILCGRIIGRSVSRSFLLFVTCFWNNQSYGIHPTKVEPQGSKITKEDKQIYKATKKIRQPTCGFW